MPFPSSLDSFATILSNTAMDDTGFEHDTIHNTANDAIEALEAKMGTGASTPSAGKVLRATGTGTSGWDQVQTADIAGNAVTIRPGVSTGSTDPVTTNTSTAALANPTLSITIPTGMTADVYVWVMGTFADTTGATVSYHIRIDSGSWLQVAAGSVSTGRMELTGFTILAGITAGAHTIEMGNSSNSAASITHFATVRRLMALGIAK